MVGLAAQRRQRGVTASVVDIGMIDGIGIIRQTEGDEGMGVMETSLRKQNYMSIAERDLHHILAEAIVAGRGSNSPEIITGLQRYDSSSDSRPVWYNNPRFSHLVADGGSSQTNPNAAGVAESSIKQKIAAASGTDEALQILEECFSTYLASLLKVREYHIP